jgi:hypothetical protein
MKQTIVSKARHAPSKRHPHLQRGLHPASLMMLLCAGVFLVAATISAFGDSYQVTAVIPGDPPATAAIITNPSDGDTLDAASQTISGSCPDNSYITLTLNGQSAGTAWCSGNTFSIAASLQAGANQMSVQDYNPQNIAGPSSPGITVTYTPPAPTPPANPTTTDNSSTASAPAVTPIALTVVQVDTGVPFVSQSTVEETTDLPTFHGVAPPLSHVTLIVHSNVIICDTNADANGYWECTLPTALPVGLHTVAVSAITKTGQMLQLPIFKIHVSGTKAALPQPAATPLKITSSYQYQAYLPNQLSKITLNLAGGNGPYVVTVNWGDNQVTSQVIAASGLFTLTHRYSSSLVLLKTFTAKVTVIDGTGQATNSQFITVVRNPAATATNIQYQPPTFWHAVLSDVHDWLWLLWPAYLIVIMMLVSFVLGERKQYEDDLHRPVAAKRKHRRHHTPHHV